MRFVGKKMGVVRIVYTGAFIDLLCFPLLVEKYVINRDEYLIKIMRIWREVLLKLSNAIVYKILVEAVFDDLSFFKLDEK